MQVINQSCKILERERIIILCDVMSYKSMKLLINEICNNYLEVEDDEFIMTDYDDYVISCNVKPFIELACAVFDLYDRKKILIIPKLFIDIFNDTSFKQVYEAIQRRRNMADLNSLKFDNQYYELLNKNEFKNMSDESKYTHLFINMEIITDSLCSHKLESNKILKDADSYNSDVPMWLYSHYEDNNFICPGEISKESSLYESWVSLCEQAYELQKCMIQNAISTNVAKSLLPSSAAKHIQCGATLGTWYLFVKSAYLSSMGHLSQNMRDLLLMMIETFDITIIPAEMSDLLTTLKNDINDYEFFPF